MKEFYLDRPTQSSLANHIFKMESDEIATGTDLDTLSPQLIIAENDHLTSNFSITSDTAAGLDIDKVITEISPNPNLSPMISTAPIGTSITSINSSSSSNLPSSEIPIKPSTTVSTPVIPSIPPALAITNPAIKTLAAVVSTSTATSTTPAPVIQPIPPALAITNPVATGVTPPAPKPAAVVATTSTTGTTPVPVIQPIPPALTITNPVATGVTPSAPKPAAVVATTSTTGTTPTPVIQPIPPALTITNPVVTGITPPPNPATGGTSPAAAPGITTVVNNPAQLGAAPIGTSITPISTPATILVGTNNLLNIQNGATRMQFTPGSASAKFHNEMGAFVVDDAQGRVNGILPGTPGYLAAAMKRSQVIGGGNDSNVAGNSSRQLNFQSGDRLGFYLVQDGTTAEIQSDLAAGRIPTRQVFFQAGNTDGIDHLKISQSGNNYTFAWEDTLGGGDRDFNDLVVNATLPLTPATKGAQLQGAQPIVDLRDISGLQQTSVTVGGSSSYDDFIGFYRVDDPTGKIGTLNPSDPGYARAAIDRTVANYNKNVGNATPILSGGGILAPYLIANGSVQSFLANNPNNQQSNNAPQAYFGYIGANPDKVEHMRLLGDNKFGFEDMFGGGDRDFNDAIIQLRLNQ